MEALKSTVEENEIKKILVKCPPGIENSFSTFPFFVALSEEFPKAEINLVCEEGTSDAYSFLPFKLRTYTRPKEKMSLVQTHHFCANQNDIFNIDLFLDLENSFNSSFMGFNFRAKERVGFGVGWNKYFLTKNFTPEENRDIENKCMRLLELYTQKNMEALRISRVRASGQNIEKIEQLFAEPEPPKFIMVMLDNFQNVSKQIEVWKKFFDSFENQKFVIWSLNDEDLISELFNSIDLGKNNLYMHRGSDPKEMVYLLNKVMGVVTNNIWAEGLCTYFGVNAITFCINQSNVFPEYHYFVFKPQRFIFSDSGEIKYKYLDEERDFSEMNLVVDHIHFHFKL